MSGTSDAMAAPRTNRAAGRRRWFGLVAAPILALVVVIALWEAIVELFDVPSYVAPTPGAAIRYVVNDWSRLQPLFLRTVQECALGFLIGVGVGIVLAVAMSEIPGVKSMLYPLVIATQATPIVAIAPPLVIIVGFGMTPKLIIVALIVFFPVVVNVLGGLASVDADMMNLVRSIGTSRLRLLLLIKLPAAMGPLGSALRLGAAYAVTGAVIGEWTATTTPGLGNDILNQQSALNTAAVFGEVLLLTGLGIVGFLIMSMLERAITPWRYRTRARGLLQSSYRRSCRERLAAPSTPAATPTRVGAPSQS